MISNPTPFLRIKWLDAPQPLRQEDKLRYWSATARCALAVNRTVGFRFRNVNGKGHLELMPLLTASLQYVHAHGGDEIFVPSAKSLSDHHLAGYMVILLGILAFLEYSELARLSAVRYFWPLPLLGTACFLFFFSDTAEPWGLWFFHGDWSHTELEHKFLEGAAILIALIELSVRTGWLKSRGWSYIIPSLMVFAGTLLVFHHGNHEPIVHTQHNWMGSEAMVLGVSKLTANLQSKPSWVARYAVPLMFVVLGLQLVFYIE
jgi:hypothetical protein